MSEDSDPILFDESQRDTDLFYFHQFADCEPLVHEDFDPKTKKLGVAILGKVKLRRWRHAPAEVIVTKEMETEKVVESKALYKKDYDAFQAGRDAAAMEDAVNEIGVFRYLEKQSTHSEHVLRTFGCFQDSNWTYLVLDYCNRGELFAIIANPSNQPSGRDVLKLMHQGAKAINYLHQHNVGHRDISLENMLVKGDDASQLSLVVMDFGQACLLHDDGGKPFCYFRLPGKSYCRGPETFVPPNPVRAKCPSDYIDNSVVLVQANGYFCQVVFREPERDSICTGEPYGYWAAPVDTFALGVCMFVSHTKRPPWKQAMLQDRCFAYILRNGIERFIQESRLTPMEPRVLELVRDLMQVEPRKRPTIEQCLAAFEGFEPAPQLDAVDPPSETATSHGNPGVS